MPGAEAQPLPARVQFLIRWSAAVHANAKSPDEPGTRSIAVDCEDVSCVGYVTAVILRCERPEAASLEG